MEAGGRGSDREALVARLLEGLQRAGYTAIRSVLPGHAPPEPIRWREGDAGHTPHVTATQGTRLHLFEVSVHADFAKLGTEERWRLFAYHAEENGAVFVIVVEAGDKARARAELRRLRLSARVMAVGSA